MAGRELADRQVAQVGRCRTGRSRRRRRSRRSCEFTAATRAGAATGRRPAIDASRPRLTLSRTVSESNSSMRWKVRPSPTWARAAGDSREIVVAVEATVPARRSHQSRAHVERRGLARAVRSDQSGDPSERGRERGVPDRGDAAEADRSRSRRPARRVRSAGRRELTGGRGVASGTVPAARPRTGGRPPMRSTIALNSRGVWLPFCIASAIAEAPNSTLS